MQVAIPSSDLTRALKLAGRAIDNRTTIPVLECALLRAHDHGAMSITAGNLEHFITIPVDASVAEAGVVAIPLRSLLAQVQSLDGDVFITVKDGWATVKCGRSRCRIPVLAADQYPEWPARPEGEGVTISGAELVKAQRRVGMAIATTESRYTLQGALLAIIPGHYRMVATDGHRLSITEGPCEGSLPDTLIPGDTLSLWGHAVGGSDTVNILHDGHNLWCGDGRTLITARKLTGQFPDYQRVLPRDEREAIALPRVETLHAVQRVERMADDMSKCVKLALKDGAVEVSGVSTKGEASDSIPVESATSLTVGLSATYIADALAAMETDTVLWMPAEDAANEFRPSGDDTCRMIVMPMGT